MNVKLKIAIIETFGSQIRASRELKLSEARLSRLVQGHAEPTEHERTVFAKRLGLDLSVQPQPSAAA